MTQTGSQLILVIEDDDHVRDIARFLLEMHGYRAITANDGPAGIAKFREQQGSIAAVVTDMRMPGMHGAQVVSALRALDPGVRIVCMTGAPKDLELPEEPGRLAHLFKPMTGKELVAALQKVCG
jgi:CheY-like chemotaxis protein